RGRHGHTRVSARRGDFRRTPRRGRIGFRGPCRSGRPDDRPFRQQRRPHCLRGLQRELSGMTGDRLRSLLAIGALALGGCATAGGGTGQAETVALAATYRYLFANNASGLKENAATYCLGIGTRAALADPPPA